MKTNMRPFGPPARGSIFSYHGTKAMTKLPRRIWFPVELNIGEPVSAERSTAAYLEVKVRELAI
ncbi:MAG: hypothetical protein A2Z20_02780 [Bdellovibrionales bacterium RBG_16_40_8]|nr:MAG: hypothetical protein A2Z20_02780 [Bdellovibrionales bacterium RBG_16_40_8]